LVFPWSFTSSPLAIFTVIVQVDVLVVGHSRAYAHILYAALKFSSSCLHARDLLQAREQKKKKAKQNRREVRHVCLHIALSPAITVVEYAAAVRHDVGVSELGKVASSDTCIDGRRAPRYVAGSGPGPVSVLVLLASQVDSPDSHAVPRY
jgi:hypothetical protein